jgi:hypothetical protein
MFALSFLYFTYSVVRFLRLEEGDSTRNEAKMAILWGIVGMLIMFSVYGIIHYLIMPSFGISPNDLRGSPDALEYLKT